MQRHVAACEFSSRHAQKFLVNHGGFILPTTPKEAALKKLATLNDSDEKIFCDEDCPELTDEQLARLMPVHEREKNFWRNYG